MKMSSYWFFSFDVRMALEPLPPPPLFMSEYVRLFLDPPPPLLSDVICERSLNSNKTLNFFFGIFNTHSFDAGATHHFFICQIFPNRKTDFFDDLNTISFDI